MDGFFREVMSGVCV